MNIIDGDDTAQASALHSDGPDELADAFLHAALLDIINTTKG